MWAGNWERVVFVCDYQREIANMTDQRGQKPKVAWNIKYLTFDQLNDYQSVTEAAVFKVSMRFN